MRSEVDHEQPVVAGVVDVADLAGVEVRQSVGGHVVASRGLGAPTRVGRRRVSEDVARTVRRRLGVRRHELLDRGRRTPRPAAARRRRSRAGRRARRRARRGRGPRRSSAASRSTRSLPSAPCSRRRSATATACSLIASWACSRPTPCAHRGHQHLGGGEERQVAVELALDHRRVGAEVVEHGEERLEQAVDGEEGVGQRDPAHDRAAHVALVPLVAGERAPTMVRWPAEDGEEPADALARPRLFILWGMAEEPTWPGRKPSVTSSWPAISRMVRGEAGRAGRRLHQRGDHVEVERAGVHLARRW